MHSEEWVMLTLKWCLLSLKQMWQNISLWFHDPNAVQRNWTDDEARKLCASYSDEYTPRHRDPIADITLHGRAYSLVRVFPSDIGFFSGHTSAQDMFRRALIFDYSGCSASLCAELLAQQDTLFAESHSHIIIAPANRAKKMLWLYRDDDGVISCEERDKSQGFPFNVPIVFVRTDMNVRLDFTRIRHSNKIFGAKPSIPLGVEV